MAEREKFDPTKPSRFGPLGVEIEVAPGVSSTELTTTVESPFTKGRFVNIPLLVPGQIDIENLIAGRPQTQEQVKRAVQWMIESKIKFPEFPSIEEAVRAAGERSRAKGALPTRGDKVLSR